MSSTSTINALENNIAKMDQMPRDNIIEKNTIMEVCKKSGNTNIVKAKKKTKDPTHHPKKLKQSNTDKYTSTINK